MAFAVCVCVGWGGLERGRSREGKLAAMSLGLRMSWAASYLDSDTHTEQAEWETKLAIPSKLARTSLRVERLPFIRLSES